MLPIAHRGLWKEPKQKNSKQALLAALTKGYGLETDIRQHNGELVISHDRPLSLEPLLLTEILQVTPNNTWIALNVKEDGLAHLIEVTMQKYDKLHWFVFDMSIPDMWMHIKLRNPVFTRRSEFETHVLLEKSSGVWLDQFENTWYDMEVINYYLDHKKQIAIVSPELHGRDPFHLWARLKDIDHHSILLCTDLPEEADIFFNRT